MSELITRLTSESVDAVMQEPGPVLVGCLLKDGSFTSNLVSLELTAMFFQGEIKAYYALEEMHPYFRKKYGVSGTPTYIVTQSGQALGTLLGRVSPGKLIEHVSEMLMSRRKQALRTFLRVNKPQSDQ
ncbi:MAG: hypothetical protein ABFD81_14640 [Syntrophaceae bacterium]